ncbi:MAG: hypothetical protein R6X23_06165 [Acidimicrobiia bacterium]
MRARPIELSGFAERGHLVGDEAGDRLLRDGPPFPPGEQVVPLGQLAMLCPHHHALAVPHGPWVLDGDPEQVDGLTWRRIDRPGATDIAARAGPAA